jgi:hypothetical protein
MAETAAAVVAPTPEAAPAKEPRVVQPKQNGVSRPKEGTKTGRVWAIADELSAAAGKPAARKDVIAKGTAESINPATLATQYGRWRRFHNLGREVKAAPPAAAAPAPAADTTVQPA